MELCVLQSRVGHDALPGPSLGFPFHHSYPPACFGLYQGIFFFFFKIPESHRPCKGKDLRKGIGKAC